MLVTDLAERRKGKIGREGGKREGKERREDRKETEGR